MYMSKLNVHESEQTLGNSEGQGSLPCCSTWGCRVGHDLVTEQQIKVILCVFFRNRKDINWMPLTLHLGTGVLTWFGCLKAPQIRGGNGKHPRPPAAPQRGRDGDPEAGEGSPQWNRANGTRQGPQRSFGSKGARCG